MENKKLAILGHPTRGKEVIKILEMLGGKNLKGTGSDETCIYTIDSTSSFIEPIPFYDFSSKYYDNLHTEYHIFPFENFLEKYPFKVGDKVQDKGSTSCGTIYEIEKMIWEDNQIKYIIYNPYRNIPKCTVTVTAEYLQPHKEEIKAEDRLEIYADPAIDDDSKTDIIINGEKLIAPNGYTVKTATMDGNNLIVEYIKNKPQYPKTYEECSQIINKVAKTTHELDIAYNPNLIYDFQKLLICRDAYWKISGEEMRLGEPWEPNFGENFIYAIGTYYGTIEKRMVVGGGILLFPTEEMRDAFFENFKDLIENCKEFL